MHTDTVTGHANLSSRSKVFVALYVGVGVSYYDPVSSQGVKSLWPPLNRKYQNKFSIATEMMKINEEHEVELLVPGHPWFSEKERAAPYYFNKHVQDGMEESKVVAYVRSSTEQGEAKNDLNNRAAKVVNIFEDLLHTGILTDINYTYYNVSVKVNQLRVKNIVERLTIEGDSRYLLVDMTELEVRYAAEFLLMHFMANELLKETPVSDEIQGSSCTRKLKNQSVVVDVETAPKNYGFMLHNIGNMVLHWKI